MDRKRSVDPTRGRRIREYRIARRLSQEALGRPLQMTAQAISAYEAGRNAIPLHRIEQLARVLRCSPGELLRPPGSPIRPPPGRPLPRRRAPTFRRRPQLEKALIIRRMLMARYEHIDAFARMRDVAPRAMVLFCDTAN